MSQFCHNCGKNLSEFGSVSFCPGCGAKIERKANDAQPQTPPVQQESAPQAQNANTQNAYTQSAYTPPVYTPPTYAQPPVYGQAPVPPPPYAGAPYPGGKKRLGGGAIVGIVLGAVALVALIIVAFALLLKPKGYSGSPAKLSGTWDAVMQINVLLNSGLEQEEQDEILGKDFDMELRLELDKSGEGTAALIDKSGDLGDLDGLDAQLKDGVLTLESEDIGFSFEGTVDAKGESLKGKITIKGEDGQSASGSLRANLGEQGEAMIASAQDEEEVPAETEESAQEEEPKATPKPAKTPKPTEETPDAFVLSEYVVGEWISQELGDGTSVVYVFFANGTCQQIATVRSDDSVDGWKTGKWYVDYKEKGTYEIVGDTMTVDLDADWQEMPFAYQVTVTDEGTMSLREEYGDGGSFAYEMMRIG